MRRLGAGLGELRCGRLGGCRFALCPRALEQQRVDAAATAAVPLLLRGLHSAESSGWAACPEPPPRPPQVHHYLRAERVQLSLHRAERPVTVLLERPELFDDGGLFAFTCEQRILGAAGRRLPVPQLGQHGVDTVLCPLNRRSSLAAELLLNALVVWEGFTVCVVSVRQPVVCPGKSRHVGRAPAPLHRLEPGRAGFRGLKTDTRCCTAPR